MRPTCPDDEPPNSLVADENVRSSAEDDDSNPGPGCQLQRLHRLIRTAGLEKPLCRSTDFEGGERCQRDGTAEPFGSKMSNEVGCVGHGDRGQWPVVRD